MKPKRVLVLDTDQKSRAAMRDRLRAAGYEVLEGEDPNAATSSELAADFAIVRRAPGAIGALPDEEPSGRISPSLAIGWLMPAAYSAANSVGSYPEDAMEHAVRIFSAIAPLFPNVDGDAAFRLASGLYALGTRNWGSSPPDETRAGGGWPADDALH